MGKEDLPPPPSNNPPRLVREGHVPKIDPGANGDIPKTPVPTITIKTPSKK